MSGHVFQANGLSGDLQIVTGGDIGRLVPTAIFVLDRVGRSIWSELHHVSLADKAQFGVPDGQRPLDSDTAGNFDTRLIDLTVDRIAAQRMHVRVERLFQVDQAALPRAVSPVLKRG